MVLVSHNYQETIKQLEIEIKQRVHSLATGQGASAEDQGEPLDAVGVDDSSKIKAGSSVVERPVCTREVPGYIPGLTYLFSSHRGFRFAPFRTGREREIYIFPWSQVHATGPRHHLASSLRIRAQGI